MDSTRCVRPFETVYFTRDEENTAKQVQIESYVNFCFFDIKSKILEKWLADGAILRKSALKEETGFVTQRLHFLSKPCTSLVFSLKLKLSTCQILPHAVFSLAPVLLKETRLDRVIELSERTMWLRITLLQPLKINSKQFFLFSCSFKVDNLAVLRNLKETHCWIKFFEQTLQERCISWP